MKGMEDVQAAMKGERRRRLTKQARWRARCVGRHVAVIQFLLKGLPLGFFRGQICQEFKFKNLLYLFLFKVR